MAEALAVVGIAASIIQLVEFGTKVLQRLNEFHSNVGEIPKSFRHIKTELPLLLDTLQRTKADIEADSITDETKKALLHVIDGCKGQITLLDNILLKALPTSGDSRTTRSGKAIWMSLRYDSKVKKTAATIRDYIQSLTFYHAATPSILLPLTGQSPSKPTPSSSVPFRRDKDFVDRAILTEIHQKCSPPASRIALVGLGGIGKSQLAIEYAYRVRDESPSTWVFWIHASNAARFEEGYQRIADIVRLPDRNKPEANILQLVYNWLCDETNGRWVMVIDNADDSGVFSSECDRSDQRSGSLEDFIPQSPNGSILITSRSRDAAFRLTGNVSDIIEVEPMDQGRALTLLQRKLKGESDPNDAAELVQALDCMPLAISQAAAYISQRAPLTTISKYLLDLGRSDQDRERLLKKDVGDARRDGRASNSTIATWQISFNHIRKERPSAARLLSLMSLFDRQGIPETLLHHQYQEDDDIDVDFEDDLYTLVSYSFVGTNVKGDEFEMHRLVQFSTKNWLELHGEMEVWKEKYITIIDDAFPNGTYETWAACQALFPHAKAALLYQPMRDRHLAQWASILANAGWYAKQKGVYGVAEEMLRQALRGYEKVFGKDHRHTLAILNELALVLHDQGKYKAAEEMNQQVLKQTIKVLGKDHPATLTIIGNLALTLKDQGKYEAAEEMYQQVLEQRIKVLGKDNPYILTTMSNLALTLKGQGKYQAAEEVMRQALKGREKVLGNNHPDTATIIGNLASLLYNQGNYEAAEEMNRKALEMREALLGKDHHLTLITVHNLGLILWRQGKHEEAAELYKRATDGLKKALGPDHAHTVHVVNKYSDLLAEMKN